jgi:hypothetical protein
VVNVSRLRNFFLYSGSCPSLITSPMIFATDVEVRMVVDSLPLEPALYSLFHQVKKGTSLCNGVTAG